jgi:hypothetical protein
MAVAIEVINQRKTRVIAIIIYACYVRQVVKTQRLLREETDLLNALRVTHPHRYLATKFLRFGEKFPEFLFKLPG